MSFDYLLKLANHCAGIKHYQLEDEINNFILNNIRIAEDMVDDVKSESDIKAEFKKLQKEIQFYNIHTIKLISKSQYLKIKKKLKMNLKTYHKQTIIMTYKIIKLLNV